MLNISHPGRYGDLLWALPTVRTLAAQHGPVRLHLPVDPANTTPMVAIQPLLERQPYIAEVVVRQDWSIELEAPRRPLEPPYDGQAGMWVHLGYRDWPTEALPFYTAALAGLDPVGVDWSPWITAESPEYDDYPVPAYAFAWSDRWFELKVGLVHLLAEQIGDYPPVFYGSGSRWETEWERYCHNDFIGPKVSCGIAKLATALASARVVVTDCSMAHVLAAAMGIPCVVVEPEEARHHPIFWPGSAQDQAGHWKQAYNPFGKLIWPVIGGDGKPSFDSRHTADLIKQVLQCR